MKWLKLLILVLPMIFILTNCGFKDIDKRFFVVGIGIDKIEKSDSYYKITIKLAIPNTEPKKGGSDFITFTEEARTLAEGVRCVKAKVDKELEFGHLKIIVFGESLAGSDLRPAIDWLIRRRDIQQVAFTAIGSPDAETVLTKKLPFESTPSNALLLSFDQTGTETNYITTEYLFDLYRRKDELGLDPVLPVITVEKDNFNINQLALLEKKEKLRTKLVLSPEETKLYNLIAFKKHRTSFQIGSEDVNFVLDVHKVSKSYEIKQYNNNYSEMKFELKINGNIEERKNADGAIDLKKCETAASEILEEKVTDLLNKIRVEEVDPLGFGLHYRSRSWKNDTKWEDWQKLYPEISFKVDVDARIRATGLVK
jgi:spore germination protein KC